MRTVIPALICVAFLMATGCDKPHSNTLENRSSILHLCPGFSETGRPSLVYGAECGELLVKENPADSQSRNISLQILRLPAISPAPKQDPLFLIQGGPGASSIEMANQVHSAFADVRKNRDLIFVDQRGTGKSNALLCESLSDAEQLLPQLEQSAKSLQLVKSCAEKYRQQIPFYTTPYAVQDLDAVRAALGYEKINLWGVSYGTRVALEYMREFPQRARTAILDGVAPVQLALPKYFQEDAMAALQAVNRACEAQQKCQALYGNIVDEAIRISQRLDSPIDITFEHPRHQQSTRVLLTEKRFSGLIFMSLYSRDLSALLPRAIADAGRGDYRLIASLSALADEQPSFKDISEGMRYTVVCNEDAHFISADDLQNSKAFLGINMLQDFAAACALWPKVSLPENYYDSIQSATPTVLLSGGRDPVTPVRWAEMVGKNLPNSLQLTAPGGNHSISLEGCLPKIIAQFIELGTTAGINGDCVQDILPLPSVLGANEKKSSASSSAVSVLNENSSVGKVQP